MTALAYAVMNPTGNRTGFVTTPVAVASQPRVARLLMAKEPTLEQVGFLCCSENTMRMAGGEFCGNATMATGVYLARQRGLSAGEKVNITVTVSGADRPLTVTAEALADGSFRGKVPMPDAGKVTRFSLPLPGKEVALDGVVFPGITHIIVPGYMEKSTAEQCICRWCAQTGAKAMGLLFWDEETQSMTPLVYVPEADTLFWESSCASGTAALGVYLSKKRGLPLTCAIRQPVGETLTVETDKAGNVFLSGKVVFEKEGLLTV